MDPFVPLSVQFCAPALRGGFSEGRAPGRWCQSAIGPLPRRPMVEPCNHRLLLLVNALSDGYMDGT